MRGSVIVICALGLVLSCLGVLCAVQFFAAPSPREWTTFSGNAGSTLVRLADVTVLSKEVRQVTKEGETSPSKKYCTILYSTAGALAECVDSAQARDDRFRAMSNMLGTLN